MAERYGGDMIYTAIAAESAIIAIVGGSIYEDLIIPSTDKSNDTINYYKPGGYGGRDEYFESRWSVDCRRDTYIGSRDLATLVFETLNREFTTVNGKYYFAVCDILSTIPPRDKTDVYNTPVSVYLRRK